MRVAVLFLLVLLLPAVLAETTHTFSEGDNYTINTVTYTVHPYNANSTILERNNARTIIEKNECLTHGVVEACLKSASETQATFSETFLGADLESEHILGTSSSHYGDTVYGNVTLTNSGEQTAEDVIVTLHATPGAVFHNDKETYVWEGRVITDITIPYRLIPQSNGSYSVNGTLEYFDGNQTLNGTITKRTVTSTIPIVYRVGYDATTTTTPTTFWVNITKTQTANVSVLISVTLPPEAHIINSTTRATQRGNTVRYTRGENHTEAKLYIEYTFTAPPTAPALLTIRYYNESLSEEIVGRYLYTTSTDDEPSLAVSIDPLTAGTPGSARIIITGNRTGTLEFNGVVHKTETLSAGEHTSSIPALPEGNYTLNISYTSEDAYGREQITQGTLLLTVLPAPPPEPIAEPEQAPPITPETPPVETPAVEPPVIAEQPNAEPLFAVAAITSATLLLILFLILHRLHKPLRRLEELTERVHTLRVALEEKRARGEATPEELAALNDLEIKLAELGNGLH
jgi:hypothetical protein